MTTRDHTRAIERLAKLQQAARVAGLVSALSNVDVQAQLRNGGGTDMMLATLPASRILIIPPYLSVVK